MIGRYIALEGVGFGSRALALVGFVAALTSIDAPGDVSLDAKTARAHPSVTSGSVEFSQRRASLKPTATSAMVSVDVGWTGLALLVSSGAVRVTVHDDEAVTVTPPQSEALADTSTDRASVAVTAASASALPSTARATIEVS